MSKIETKNNIPAFHAPTREAWRDWLQKNQHTEKAVQLIIYHKKSKTPGINYAQAIEVALCFGWIDSTANKRDAESSYLMFTLRKPQSLWSNVNRERADRMIKEGWMTPTGQAYIDLAKRTGTWDSMKDAQNGVIPDDLQQLFKKNKTALKHFEAFPPSSRRLILEWVAKAKRPETRLKRMEETIELAAQNIKAHHPVKK